MRNLETGAIGVHGPPEIVLTSIDHYETDSDESEIGMPALLIRGDGDYDDESSIESNELNVENNQLKPLPLVRSSAQSDGESGVYPSWGTQCESDDDESEVSDESSTPPPTLHYVD